ncbi:SDR family oxidoreductase [Myxococcota bacterium]|nr:SDR family oxidoreductase [Myxococcota bacterium]
MSGRNRPVAFITGASRGIGKACALHLARVGFDVAISARSVREGEEREHSSTVTASNMKPLPGSLTTTAELVTEEGAEALIVPADLLDRASLVAAAREVLDTWGQVDVLVHNGRYIGPGHMDRFLDTPLELIEHQLEANVLATLVLNKVFLPAMVERGSGIVINITSAAGYADPTEPAGKGGWGMGYGISKGALQRIAGFLAVEFADHGIRAFNVQPGFIATERMAADMGEFGFDTSGAPPDVVGAVVAWLATREEAAEFNGRTVEGQFFCHEQGLLPDWEGPMPNTNAIAYDRAAANLERAENDIVSKD